MWFSTFVIKNLMRRPIRSVLTVMAIAIAIGSVVALVGIATGFEQTFLQIYETNKVDIIVVRAHAQQRLNSALDEVLGDKIQEIAGVRQVLPGLADMISFQQAGLLQVLVQGWVPETAVFDHLTIPSGRALKKDDGKAAMLGTILAQNLGVSVGQTVELIEGEHFTVVGIYEAHNVFEDGALIIPLKQLQRIMDRPNQVTGFSVILERQGDAALTQEVRRHIETLGSGIAALSTRDHIKGITEIQLAKGMAWLTSAIALFIGFFGMMNTMLMSVMERTREIGILRAVGWRISRVIAMVLLEAVFLSLVGAAAGTLAAFVLLRVLVHVPAVNGIIAGHIEPLLVLESVLLALLLGLVGSALPAYRATRMLPTEALRYE